MSQNQNARIAGHHYNLNFEELARVRDLTRNTFSRFNSLEGKCWLNELEELFEQDWKEADRKIAFLQASLCSYERSALDQHGGINCLLERTAAAVRKASKGDCAPLTFTQSGQVETVRESVTRIHHLLVQTARQRKELITELEYFEYWTGYFGVGLGRHFTNELREEWRVKREAKSQCVIETKKTNRGQNEKLTLGDEVDLSNNSFYLKLPPGKAEIAEA